MAAPRSPAVHGVEDGGNGNNGNGTSTFRTLLMQTLAELSVVQHDLGNIQAQNATIIQENQRAAESRSRLHEKLNQVIVEQAITRQTVDRIAPLVDKHEGQHNRAAGERVGKVEMGKLAWALLAGAAGFIAFALHEGAQIVLARWK